MWAAGIITYQLIYGIHPLDESSYSRQEMEECLKNYTELKYPTNVEVSVQAKHLISSLLQKSISGRFAPSAALNHPWITRKLNEKLPLTR